MKYDLAFELRNKIGLFRLDNSKAEELIKRVAHLCTGLSIRPNAVTTSINKRGPGIISIKAGDNVINFSFLFNSDELDAMLINDKGLFIFFDDEQNIRYYDKEAVDTLKEITGYLSEVPADYETLFRNIGIMPDDTFTVSTFAEAMETLDKNKEQTLDANILN